MLFEVNSRDTSIHQRFTVILFSLQMKVVKSNRFRCSLSHRSSRYILPWFQRNCTLQNQEPIFFLFAIALVFIQLHDFSVSCQDLENSKVKMSACQMSVKYSARSIIFQKKKEKKAQSVVGTYDKSSAQDHSLRNKE